ncbi:MAG: hypothetical protein WKF96_00680 [Solirubrobacteraceae bacterium]
MSTKAEQTYETVSRLVEQGIEQADAFRQVAEQTGLKYDSVRGAFYGHKRVLERGDEPGEGRSRASGRRSRKRETTTQDAVASAVATLRGAIDSIESELETARERAAEATAEYEAMQAAVGGRIEEIRAKIAVLDPEADDASSEPATTGSEAKTPTTTAGKPDTGKAARKEAKGS